MKHKDIFVILCESELGLDPFGNPIGKPFIMEVVGEEMFNYYKTKERADSIAKAGNVGNTKVLRMESVL